ALDAGADHRDQGQGNATRPQGDRVGEDGDPGRSAVRAGDGQGAGRGGRAGAVEPRSVPARRGGGDGATRGALAVRAHHRHRPAARGGHRRLHRLDAPGLEPARADPQNGKGGHAMGEGTVGLSASSNGGPETSARTAARRLDDEIGMLRAELTTLVSELDRRRHEALDVRLQIKRRAPSLAIAAVALAVAAPGFVWWRARQARQMAPLGARANALRHRLSRMTHPPSPPREPNAVGRILTTAATAAAATAMRRGIDWGLRSVLEYRRIEDERRS